MRVAKMISLVLGPQWLADKNQTMTTSPSTKLHLHECYGSAYLTIWSVILLLIIDYIQDKPFVPPSVPNGLISELNAFPAAVRKGMNVSMVTQR